MGLVGLGLILLTAGCSDSTSPIDELSAAEDRWEAYGPASYDATIMVSCECTPEMSGPVRVSVRDGVVVSKTYVATGQPVISEFTDSFPDVDGLFLKIRRLIEDGVHTVDVEYAPLTGYPAEIGIDRDAMPVDGGLVYTITVVAIP